MSGPAWWQRGAIYQIYPRSFNDADGDGVGDLAGITARLDHLERAGGGGDLAVAVLPLADGRLRLRRLGLPRRRPGLRHARRLRRARGRLPRARHPGGDRLGAEPHVRPASVVRGVARRVARTRSATGTSGATRRPDGGPPNDWTSQFRACGAAWTLDAATGQFYLHSFMPQQPDLNWENPEVEAAMHDTLRFWLDRGVDGFRLDAIHKHRQGPAAARPRRRAAPPRRGLGHDPRPPARDPPRASTATRTA